MNVNVCAEELPQKKKKQEQFSFLRLSFSFSKIPGKLSSQIQLAASTIYIHLTSLQLALAVKNLPASAGNNRNVGSILGSGRSPEERNGNPL